MSKKMLKNDAFFNEYIWGFSYLIGWFTIDREKNKIKTHHNIFSEFVAICWPVGRIKNKEKIMKKIIIQFW